jgi:DNA-binding NarL/FixJ family response regulator
MPITVAIVEDNSDYRAGIAFILRSSPVCTCLAECSSAEELIEALDEVAPQVVLMDIELPGMSGIEATAILKKDRPDVEVVILSTYGDDDKVFRAICAGASGYVTKPVSPVGLLEAVEYASSGGTPMSPHIARRVIELFRHHVPPPMSEHSLTSRELEILQLLVRGNDCGQIADSLFLSVFTVRAHLRSIYEKLHVHSNTQAVAEALKQGLVMRP